ncbi:hypothetical protein [Massilia antarctica]|uniref:hypothetical protein n=1 Tax=Massilia antarctica TaxID=2765360 RepID=UPI0006BB7623|nr:hypothetical protein [Massilia sp. H27-R4]MCY0911383.1 hypothetical protein [Massilia sp. H27-R4]CUI05013.1 Flagellar biosynthesis protein FliR [Janthinobacterium sp. CG23_2]CUU28799.1 Flagellar biosynthesis protein FliR [Janthinobacterium sp. CG23_2]
MNRRLGAFARGITFSLPCIGESLYSPSKKITLVRTHERSCELVDLKVERGLLALSATSSNIARLVGQIAFGFPIALGDMLLIVMVLPYLGNPFQLLFNEGIETARRVPRMAATPPTPATPASTDRSAALPDGPAQGAPAQPP